MTFPLRAVLVVTATCLIASVATARPVYRCPGPTPVYTDALTPAEARERNCRTIETAPLTVVQAKPPEPRDLKESASPAPTNVMVPPPSAPARGEMRVDSATQRARDSDARRILQEELQKEERLLADLQRGFNNGQPERRPDERDAQAYQQRVQDLKAAVDRKTSDVAAIKRELSKLAP